MEKLKGDLIKVAGDDVPAAVVFNVREFMILFYGSSSCQNSHKISKALNSLVSIYNTGDGEFEETKNMFNVLYISND